LRLLVLPEGLRSELKNPLGELFMGNGVDCIESMRPQLVAAKKIAAVGDMTAFYLHEASIEPDLAIVDNKTKRMPTPDHVRNNLENDSYKTLEVVNPPATLNCELIELVRSSLAGKERIKIIVEGEEDLATLPVILYAPIGSAVIYGQPNVGIVLVKVTLEKKEQIKDLMDKKVLEE
jgi:uncharacterized protein (UPF0218 family)